MKKWSCVLVLILIFALFSACGVTGWDGSESSAQEDSAPSSIVNENVTDESFDDNLSGLVAYLTEAGVITGNTENMQAGIIGATNGVRFNAKEYSIELYEYDLSNLNEAAQTTLASVREKGSFELLGFEAKAMLSDSGKYLMVFNESESEAPIAEAVKKVFSVFKK